MKRTKKAAPKSGFVVHEDHRFHARPRGQTVLRRANGPRKPRNWAGPRSSPTARRGGCGWSANEGGPAKRAAREAALKSSNAGQRRSHEAQNAAPNDAEEQDPSDERGLHARLLIWVSARKVTSASYDRLIGEIKRFDQHVVGHARIATHHLRADLVCPIVVSSGIIVFLAFADVLDSLITRRLSQ
jgi:hypothetical protein